MNIFKYILILFILIFNADHDQIHAQHSKIDNENSNKKEVEYLLLKTFDKPDNKLLVNPIVIEKDYAIAGWTQGSAGGRALLNKKSDKWIIILCSGDELKKVQLLKEIGMNDTDALNLSNKLAIEETKISPQKLAMFALFKETMKFNH